jgi:hypothetical protein
MCLFGQILQEKSIHRALESDVQVGDVAFGDRDDVDAGKRQSLEQGCGVLLIATESVKRLGQDDVESPVQRIAHQCLESRAQQRGAGHRVVRVLLADRPTLPLGKRAAHAQLIGDRRVPLVVRRVARVDGDLQCSVTSGCVSRSAATSRSNRLRAACRARTRTSTRKGSSG